MDKLLHKLKPEIRYFLFKKTRELNIINNNMHNICRQQYFTVIHHTYIGKQ